VRNWVIDELLYRGVARGGGTGTPNPIPLKLLTIKRVRTRHALRIRLIEVWMSWMNWELRIINCYELVCYSGQKSCVALTSFIQCHGLWLGLPTVPYFPGRPLFRGLCPESRLGSSRDAIVPYFCEAKVKNFWCDATPIYIKFHPETLKLMRMGRQH